MSLLDVFFPKRCVGCQRVGRYLCFQCRGTLPKYVRTDFICPVCQRPAIGGMTHPRCRGGKRLDGLVSIYRYTGIVRSMVKALKYGLVSDSAAEIVSTIPLTSYNMIPVRNDQKSTIIPIPLFSSRLRSRGFNQAELLAKYISVQLGGISIDTGLLTRTKATIPQVEMKTKEDRLKNMKQAFTVTTSGKNTSYTSIVLLDDVYTTGATLTAAAQALKRPGISVWAFTLAR